MTGLSLLTGCNVGERPISVENCGEPITVSDCRWQGQLYSCVLQNNAGRVFQGSLLWRYDADNTLQEYAPYRYGTGLEPGEKRREKLPVSKFNNDTTARIVFCNTRPH